MEVICVGGFLLSTSKDSVSAAAFRTNLVFCLEIVI